MKFTKKETADIVRHYKKNKSITAAANYFLISTYQVTKVLCSQGVYEVRNRGVSSKVCPSCNEQFMTNGYRRKYCSNVCAGYTLPFGRWLSLPEDDAIKYARRHYKKLETSYKNYISEKI